MRTRPPSNASAGFPGGWNAGIHTYADLAAVATVNVALNTIIAWIKSDDNTEQTWRLLNSTAETDEGAVQRPDDYDATLNPKVWFRAA